MMQNPRLSNDTMWPERPLRPINYLADRDISTSLLPGKEESDPLLPLTQGGVHTHSSPAIRLAKAAVPDKKQRQNVQPKGHTDKASLTRLPSLWLHLHRAWISNTSEFSSGQQVPKEGWSKAKEKKASSKDTERNVLTICYTIPRRTWLRAGSLLEQGKQGERQHLSAC